MMNLRERVRNAEWSSSAWRVHLAGIGVCLGLSALVYGIAVQPMLGQHDRYLAQQAQLSARRQQAGEATAALAAAKAELAGLNDALAASPLQLQPAELINQRLALLTDLATQAGLRVDTIEPGKPVAGARFDAMPLQLTGGGTNRDCTAFVRRMRRSLPDTAIGSLDLAAGTPDGSGAAVPAKFDMNLIWYTASGKAAAK